MPSPIAVSAIASDSSTVLAPSSMPGRMWQWRSTIFARSALRSSKSLPGTEQKQQYGKHLAHAARVDAIGKLCAENAAEKESWNEQGARKPKDVSRLCVGNHGKQTGRRDQSDEAGALRFVLIERQKKAKNGHQNDPTANAEHP